MPLFRRHDRTTTTTPRERRSYFSRFRRKDPNRIAGGYRAALSNPNTTIEGRREAKAQLRHMGRDTHVPFMTKVRRALGIRSSRNRRTHYD